MRHSQNRTGRRNVLLRLSVAALIAGQALAEGPGSPTSVQRFGNEERGMQISAASTGRVGRGVAAADVNGDSRLEWVVGDVRLLTEHVNIYFLDDSSEIASTATFGRGLGGVPISAVPAGARFGYSLAAIGGLGGSAQWLAVGAPYLLTGAGARAGGVFLARLSSSGAVETLRELSDGSGGIPSSTLGESSQFGSAVAFLGDIDGDGGHREIAVGAVGHSEAGSVFVVWLNSDGVAQKLVHIPTAASGFAPVLSNGAFGSSITRLQRPDSTITIAVGAEEANLGSTATGAVMVLDLSTGTGEVERATLVGSGSGIAANDVDKLARFGSDVASLGDINGNASTTALAVAAPGIGAGDGTSEGVLFVVFLSLVTNQVASYTTIAPGSTVWPLSQVSSSANVGGDMAFLADSNGDGSAAEILAGAPLQADGGALFRFELVTTHTSSLQVADSLLPLVTATAGTSTPVRLWRGDEWPRAQLEPLSSTPSMVLPVQLPSAVSRAGATVYVDDQPCAASVVGPAWLLHDRAVLCVGPPTGLLGKLAAVRVVAGGLNYTAPRSVQFGSPGSIGTFRAATSLAQGGTPLPDPVAGSNFGSSVAWLGDLDGDGIRGEVVLGADQQDPVQSGAVYVAWLAVNETAQRASLESFDATAAAVIESQVRFALERFSTIDASTGWPGTSPVRTKSRFGCSATALRIHGDVYGTAIAVGAYADDTGGSSAGAVFLLRLNHLSGAVESFTKLHGGLETMPSEDFPAEAGFGRAVTMLKPSTLIVGAPHHSESGAIASLVVSPGFEVSSHVLLTNGQGGVPANTIPASAQFGTALACGDVDGDGVNEIFVGAPGAFDTTGAVVILWVSNTAVVEYESHRLLTNGAGGLEADLISSSALFGSALAAMDLDQDSRAELVVGAPRESRTGSNDGAMFVFQLDTSGEVTAVRPLARGINGVPDVPELQGVAFGSSVALVGDVNGGGHASEILVGAIAMSNFKQPTAAITGNFAGGSLGQYVLRDVSPIQASAISVSSIVPATAVPQAGTATTIWGTGFSQAEFTHASVAVSVGGQPCAGARVSLAGTSITCMAPPGYGRQAVAVSIGGAVVTHDDQSRPLEVVYAAPVLSAISALDTTQLPQAGGIELIINGANLADAALFASASVTLTVGPYPCASVTRKVGGGQIVCDALPPGVGGPHLVQVGMPGGVVSNGLSVSYEPSQVLSTDPAAVVPSLYANASMNISGTRFGQQPGDVTRIVLGGNDCMDITWVSSSQLACNSFSLSGLQDKDIVVWQGSVASVGGENRLQYPDPPRIVGTVPSVVSPLGEENITFFAANLASSSIASIAIADSACTAWTVDDGFQGTCTVPPGVGKDKHATILTTGGIRGVSDRPLISYAAPTVTGLEPGFASSDPSKQIDFNITGTNFGDPVKTPGAVSAVSVGEVACSNLVHVSDSLIRCTGMRAPWGQKLVSVTVGGVSTSQTGLFDYFPAPEIASLVLPAVRSTAGGDTLQILGSGFGSISGVSIGGTPCASFTRQSASQIDCVTPAGVGTGLVVRVLTAANGADETTNVTGHFAYSAATVTAVSPSAVGVSHVLAGESAVSLDVSVSHAGSSLAQLSEVGVRTASPAFNATCASVTVLTTGVGGQITQIRCHDLSLAGAPAIGETQLVPFLKVAGQASAESGAASLQMLGRPEINVITPATELPTTGLVPSGSPPAQEGGAAAQTPMQLTVLGSWFGDAGDVVSVEIGGTATNFTYVSSTELRVDLVPGVGASIDVVVQNRGGQSSMLGTRQISYAVPRVTTVSPSYLMAGETNESVTIAGLWFGNSAKDVDLITVAGQPCNLTAHSPTELLCDLVSAITQTPLPTLGTVVVEVAGQASRTLDLPIVGVPVVQAISPSVVSTLGSGNASTATVTVLGMDFGRRALDVVGVTVGGKHAPRVEWVSDSELRISVPPGVGRTPGVIVTTRGGQTSIRNDQLGYEQAEVTAISPDYALTGNLSLSFTITGSNLGNAQADVTAVTVGGNPCARVAWQSATSLRCEGVSASGWQSGEVMVTVGGQSGLRNALLERFGSPTIRAVSPVIAEVGQAILVFGTEFGRSLADIQSLTVDGEPCPGLIHQGATALQCNMPQPSAARTAAGLADPNAYGNLAVVVTTAGGLSSSPGRISYPGAGDAPPVAPAHVSGWRHRGAAGQMLLRWSFPEDDVTDNVAAITSFNVETAPADAIPDPTSGTVASALSASILLAQATAYPTDGNRTVFFVSQAAAQATPLMARAQAVNPSGAGPWSNWSAPIAANCEASQFLTTQMDVGAWDCTACPPGAFCGGATADTVTALPGFWRVPWSPAGIGFAPCPVASACIGYSSAAAGARNASSNLAGSRRMLQAASSTMTLAQALQQWQLVEEVQPAVSAASLGTPSGMEACAEGFAGVLCTECAAGFTRWGAYDCRQCAEPAVVAVAMTWVVIAVFVVIAALIIGALRTGRSDSSHKKTVIPVVKIVFSHLQSVAIAASFNLSWPDAVLDLFSSMQIASSVSADALSLDCALPDLSRRFGSDGFSIFFARSSVVLSSPFILVAAAVAFWLVVVPWLQCDCVHSSLRAIGLADRHHPASAVQADAAGGCAAGDGPGAEAGGAAVGGAGPDPRQGRGLPADDTARPKALSPTRISVGGACGPAVTAAGIDAKAMSSRAAATASTDGPAMRSHGGGWLESARPVRPAWEAASAGPTAAGSSVGDDAGPDGQSTPLDLAAHDSADVWGSRSSARPAEAVAAAGSDPEGASTGQSGATQRALAVVESSGGVPMRRVPSVLQRRRVQLSLCDKVKLTTIVVAFSVHMSVTKASLALLTCSDIDHEGIVASGEVVAAAADSPLMSRDSCVGSDASRRLAAELSICCWDPRAQAWMYGLGFPGLALYAFGIPVATALLLWRKRSVLATDARVRTTLGFLFMGFRKEAYYWEAVIMARKALIATIAVLLAPSGSAMQTYAALFVVFLVTCAHIIVDPYQQQKLNRLELAGLFAAFITFECGLFLSDPLVGADAAVAATVGIFLANVAFLAAAAAVICRASVIDSGFAASVSRTVRWKSDREPVAPSPSEGMDTP